jgi:hypothetical protein
MGNPSPIDPATLALVGLAADIATGDQGALRDAIGMVLEAELPEIWVEELILQSVLMVGWPRSLLAAAAWREISGVPDVADQMGGGVGVPVRVAVEARDAAARPHRPAILHLVELLLGERRQQQAQPVELLGVQDPVEQLEEVVERHELPLRDVPEVGARDEEDRGRELGKEVVGEVEVQIEALQVALLVALDGVDVELREHHPALGMVGVGQGQEPEGKGVAGADLLRGHPVERVPRHAGGQPGPHPVLHGLAPEHLGVARAVRQVVPLGEQGVVLLLKRGPGGSHPLPDGLEGLLDDHRREARLALRRGRGILARRVLRHGESAPGQRDQKARGERRGDA